MDRCWYYHRTTGKPPERCTLPDGHEPATGYPIGGGHLYPSMLAHDCEPSRDLDPRDVRCVTCGARAEIDPPEVTAAILEGIAERIMAQVEGQSTWLA